MPVLTTKNKSGPYNCNGTQTEFTFDFPIFGDDELEVVLRDADGNDKTLILGSEYTVSAPNNDFSSGGKVTTSTTYASGNTITINRKIEITQQTDYVEGDSFPAETHEDIVDRLTMISQMQKELLDRSLKFPVSDPSTVSSLLPSILQRKGKYLMFDLSTGNPVAVTHIEPGTVLITSYMETLLDDPDAAAARKTLGFTDILRNLQLANWTQIEKSVTGYFYFASFGGGAHFYAAAQNDVQVSKNGGINWSTRDMGWTSGYAYCHAYGNSMHIVAGYDGTTNGVLSSSPDTVTWTQRTIPFGTNAVWGAAYGAGVFVIVGGGGKTATSPDGITWTERTNVLGTDAFNGVLFGNGLFVAYTGTGRIATSPDGIDWTEQTSPFGGSAIKGGVYGNGLYVLGGSGAKIAISTDGINWTLHSCGFTYHVEGIAYGNGIFLAVGGTLGTLGEIAWSEDGITWTAINIGWYGAPDFMKDIAFGNGRFLVVGSCSQAAISMRVL